MHLEHSWQELLIGANMARLSCSGLALNQRGLQEGQHGGEKTRIPAALGSKPGRLHCVTWNVPFICFNIGPFIYEMGMIISNLQWHCEK